jgi:eukaryotic-like serine/threonine-protein kinase
MHAVEATRGGRARFVLIGGEPGSGKTRLAEVVAERAAATGLSVLWGRPWEAGGLPPYWAFVQVLRSLLSRLPEETAMQEVRHAGEALVQLLPEFAEPGTGTDQSLAADDEGARSRLFEAVARLLERAGRREPLLMILDDLHAADGSSLLLLSFLGHRLMSAPVALLVTYRDQELPAGNYGRTVVVELARQPGSVQLTLGGLSAAEIEEYVRRLTGHEPAPRAVEALFAETDGNPLFVTELVRDLDSRQELHDRSLGASPMRLPESVTEVIDQRIKRLSPEAGQLLSVASVVGRDFSLRLVADVAQLTIEEVTVRVEEAVGSGLVLRDGPAYYRFSHMLVRDVLYEALTVAERLRLHAAVGIALERWQDDPSEERMYLLAHHFVAAAPLGHAAKAVECVLLAGQHAVSRLAYEEAARLFIVGLDVVEGSKDEERVCDLLVALGDALMRAGDTPAAKRRFRAAAELADRAGLVDHLARAALGYGGRFVWEASRGDPHLAPLLRQALDRLGPGDSALRARLLARLAGGPLRDEPETGQRTELSAEAVAIARRLGEPRTLAYVLDGRYAAVWGPDRLEERLGIAAELVELARQIGDRERELQGHHYLALARLEAADLAGAERAAAEQRRLAELLRQPSHLMYVRVTDAALATLQGRYSEAEALIAEAVAIGERAERAMVRIYSLFGRYAIARDRGSQADLIPELVDAVAEFPSYQVIRALLAEAYVAAGRREDGRRLLHELGRDGLADLPRNDEWLFAVSTLGDVCAELEDRGLAPTLYAALEPFEERAAVSAPDACSGAVARVLARLAAVSDRRDEARRLFELALDVNQRLNARPSVARTRYQYGLLLAASGEPSRAAGLLEAAADDARALGMSGLSSEIAGLSAASEHPTAADRRTFLFTDIVGSTDLVAALGDEPWRNVVAWHDRTLRALFAAHGGREISNAGDGFFVAFSTPGEAVACAKAIQRSLAAHRRDSGFAPAVRIGIHATKALPVGQGYRGLGVHVAARIAAAASGGEILVSGSTLADLPGEERGAVRSLQLKGIRDPVAVAAVDWQ